MGSTIADPGSEVLPNVNPMQRYVIHALGGDDPSGRQVVEPDLRDVERVEAGAAGRLPLPTTRVTGSVRPVHPKRWGEGSTEHLSRYARSMARSLHVRLDDTSAAALEIIRASGLTDSEAVRTALREVAARRRIRSAVRDEVRRLAADEHDRAEMQIIRAQLAQLAPPTSD